VSLGGASRDPALAARAREVLRRNDLGGWTRAAPGLYPHQWSWDSAFIAIGLAHIVAGCRAWAQKMLVNIRVPDTLAG